MKRLCTRSSLFLTKRNTDVHVICRKSVRDKTFYLKQFEIDVAIEDTNAIRPVLIYVFQYLTTSTSRESVDFII